MKFVIRILLILLVVAIFMFGFNVGRIFEEKEQLKSQTKLLNNSISLLKEQVSLLEQDIVLRDDRILLLEESTMNQESEINSLLEFVRITVDYQDLVRIVEAEAGGEKFEGKLLVASVVLNRVGSFAGTVHDVIYQPRQFSPVQDGRFYRVKVSQDSIAAVEDIIKNGSSTEALFFMNPVISNENSRDWMRTLTYVDTVGNHEFYR